jgi:capsular polysaccharide biosynthesis protein
LKTEASWPAAAHAEAPAKLRPKRVFLSRKDTRRRELLNEQELIDRLKPYGFEPIVMSQLSLAEQIETIRNAREIIAPHGAGLAHLS